MGKRISYIALVSFALFGTTPSSGKLLFECQELIKFESTKEKGHAGILTFPATIINIKGEGNTSVLLKYDQIKSEKASGFKYYSGLTEEQIVELKVEDNPESLSPFGAEVITYPKKTSEKGDRKKKLAAEIPDGGIPSYSLRYRGCLGPSNKSSSGE